MAQNGVNVVTGAMDIAENGVKLENGLKVVGGGVATVGDVSGIVKVAKSGGCFVVDTPVAVGWEERPIYVGQAAPSAEGADSDWNAGWFIAGAGIGAVTIVARNGRDRERDERKKRSLHFARDRSFEAIDDDDLCNPC